MNSWQFKYNQAAVSALYLHIPFCSQKCFYCDFSSWSTRQDDSRMKNYVKTLKLQLDEAAQLGLLAVTKTVYMGGGTPSLLGQGAVDLAHHTSSITHPIEFSMEANPDSLSDELLASLSAGGVTRISLGVQSFNDNELKELGRIHSADLAYDRVLAAKKSGYEVSVDLMCAIPEQTESSWEYTLSRFISLGVNHVSVYPLTIEDGTALAKQTQDKDIPWNAYDVQADRMQTASKMLQAAGFERYEVASYARNQKSCKHNKMYWTGESYLGLGTSAASMLTAFEYDALAKENASLPLRPQDATRVRLVVLDFPKKIAEGVSLFSTEFDVEFLTHREAVAEDLMLHARLTEPIEPALLDESEQVFGALTLQEVFDACVQDELLECVDAADSEIKASYRPTKKGWLLGNELYGRFWELR
ncbi:radical SAM family heme chaperone HemW [Lancefieldella parvula]|uniref:radical SAM family heme chaperone HemW n=1 Tax=Lancefieldella parvula TaxID=1382 RepID=UPI00288AFA07|nr:radical SAM family heme chaperone HemW [Lancefieldella parvula]